VRVDERAAVPYGLPLLKKAVISLGAGKRTLENVPKLQVDHLLNAVLRHIVVVEERVGDA